MTELFSHIANVVVPIALCALIGYGLAVMKRPFDRKMIGTLVHPDIGLGTVDGSNTIRDRFASSRQAGQETARNQTFAFGSSVDAASLTYAFPLILTHQ